MVSYRNLHFKIEFYWNSIELPEQYNQHCHENDLSEQCSLQSNGDQNEGYNNCQNNYSNECGGQYQDNYQNEYQDEYPNEYQDNYQDNYKTDYKTDYKTEYQTDYTPEDPHRSQGTPDSKGPEILYKSSKELYKAVAKECGITCKMSDNCKCLDCQSRYFDCEYDQVSLEIILSNVS